MGQRGEELSKGQLRGDFGSEIGGKNEGKDVNGTKMLNQNNKLMGN
jgi:hypothetical protein